MRKRVWIAAVGCMVSVSVLAAQKAPPKPKPYQVKVDTERADALYALGNDVRFLVSVSLGEFSRWLAKKRRNRVKINIKVKRLPREAR